jgi:Flp pilus assembly protein TadG
MTRRRTEDGERGAAAVELALVAPLLLLLLFGFVEIGLAFNTQLGLSAAAREGARAMAIQNDWPTARTQAIAAVPGMGLTAAEFTPAPVACVAGANTTVTVVRSVSFDVLNLLRPFFPSISTTRTLRGVAVMRCGG